MRSRLLKVANIAALFSFATYPCLSVAANDAADAAVGNVLKASLPITVAGSEYLPATKKLVVSNFVVEFQKSYEKTKQGFSFFGLGNSGSSTATNDVTLPDAATLQTIANFAYLDIVTKLRDKGYEVIHIDGLSAVGKQAYENLASGAPIKSGEAMVNIDGDSVLFSPDGMRSAYPQDGCGHYQPEKTVSKFGAELSAMGKMYATAENAQRENLIAKAEGNVPLLKVWLTVGFGEVDAKGGNAFISDRQRNYAAGQTTTTFSNSANASAKAGLFLKPEATRFSIAVPTDSNYRYTYNQRCGTQLTKFSKVPPPADGDVLIQLGDKYSNDGSKVVALENQAASVAVTDTYIGGGMGLRRIKENADGTSAQSGGGSSVQLALAESRTSGAVDTKGMGTSLHTTSRYVSTISADYYAIVAVKLIDDVGSAFIAKLKKE